MRYFHLDSLRSFLMMYGIILHSTTLGSSLVYASIQYASGLVRMEAFFIISGFLSALTFCRYGSRKMLQKRIVRIGIPLCFGLVLLNPLANYLVYSFHNSTGESLLTYLLHPVPAGAEGPMVWHLQLWFLFPLLVYALITPFAHRALADLENLAASWRRIFGSYTLSMFFLMIAVCAAGFRVFYTQLLCKLIDIEPGFIGRETFYYLPFFLFGIVLYRYKNLLEEFQTPKWSVLLISLTLLGGVEYLATVQDGAVIKLCLLAVRALVAMTLSNLLFFLAKRYLSSGSSFFRFMSDASYSVYMLHYLFIYVFAMLLAQHVANNYVLASCAGALTLLTTIALHRHLISGNRYLALLVNGKPWWKE